MAKDKDQDYYGWIISLLDNSYLSPYQLKYKWLGKIVKYFLTPSIVIVYCCIFYKIIYLDNVLGLAAVMESVSVMGHVFFRKLTLVFRYKLLMELLEDRKKFWKYNLFGDEMAEKYHKEVKIFLFIFKTMIVSGSFTLVVLAALAALMGELPEMQWIPTKDYGVYQVMFVLQCIHFCEIVFTVLIVDGMYIVLSADMQVQFKLLGEALHRIDMTNPSCYGALKKCVSHHLLLLRVHAKMGVVYSELFLGLFLMSLTGVSMQFYTFDLITDNFAKFKCIQFTITYLLNVGLIYIPTGNISTESEHFADKIFTSGWYLAMDKNVRHYIYFMLMRANKPLEMSAGGFFEVNRAVYITIFRSAFSFATIMKRTSDIN